MSDADLTSGSPAHQGGLRIVIQSHSTSGSPAYQSTLRIVFDSDPNPPTDVIGRPARATGETDASDPALADLRRRVVDPVVASLFTPDELDELALQWESPPRSGNVWVRLVAGGERFAATLIEEPLDDSAERESLEDVAARLADRLEDFVCETEFAWGQHRIAHYQLPPD